MNIKKVVLILLIYLLTLGIAIMIGYLDMQNFVDKFTNVDGIGYLGIAIFPMIIAVFIHIMLNIAINIYLKYNSKVDIKYKELLRKLPIATLFVWIPLGLLVVKIINFISGKIS